MNKIDININRLTHMLSLYGLSEQDLLSILNQGRKKEITKKDVFSSQIEMSLLKQIDGIFSKGLNYYINPRNPKALSNESIFFRKNKFNTELNLSAKQIVAHFEEEKISFSAVSKLADIKIMRKLHSYSTNNSPQYVAQEVSKILYPKFSSDKRKFLKALIEKLAEQNILVFEFVETWNKKEKANIDGFYLMPNTIVLKRQKLYSREIFTLAHELGHYLINVEEIDSIKDNGIMAKGESKIERWCNDFAYYFLIGDKSSMITNMERATSKNDYQHELIEQISKSTNLSELAIYTRLRINDKISYQDYYVIMSEYKKQFDESEEKLKEQRISEKFEGISTAARTAKPINSPLYVNAMQVALTEGLIGEYEYCKRLNIKSENIRL